MDPEDPCKMKSAGFRWDSIAVQSCGKAVGRNQEKIQPSKLEAKYIVVT